MCQGELGTCQKLAVGEGEKGNKNKIKGKQKKLRQKEWKLTAKKLLKPLHLSKSGIMLQSLLAHYLFIMKE